ncbi:MAG: hypothetical protein NT074_01235 [Methanomicrobiales archaeon]|nr:hypothetical protein [Methanomicrobiales archaeon]
MSPYEYLRAGAHKTPFSRFICGPRFGRSPLTVQFSDLSQWSGVMEVKH